MSRTDPKPPRAKPASLSALLREIRACTLCAGDLPEGPRPVLQASRCARILIVGQAPGRRVHASGRPFDDPSGDRLRDWLGVDRDAFYDPKRFSIVPMGFCYPGTGRAGDLPPRPECAATWRTPLLARLPGVETTIVLGRYALDWHWSEAPGPSLGAAVRAWRERWPELVPMPHPSPRNNRWLRENPWFEREVVPALRRRVRRLLSTGGPTRARRSS